MIADTVYWHSNLPFSPDLVSTTAVPCIIDTDTESCRGLLLTRPNRVLQRTGSGSTVFGREKERKAFVTSCASVTRGLRDNNDGYRRFWTRRVRGRLSKDGRADIVYFGNMLGLALMGTLRYGMFRVSSQKSDDEIDGFTLEC